MKTKYPFILIFAFIFVWSCKQQDIPAFDSDLAGVYFQRLSSWTQSSTGVITSENYTDSTAVSFSGAPTSTQTHIIGVDILTMGKQRDYDRPVKVIIDPERTTAVEGVHFEVNTDTLAIKAGESVLKMQVRFLRTADMTENTYCVAFKLQDNEHFKCLLPSYKSNSSYTSTADEIPGNKFIISVSERYSAPSYWSTASAFFGDWSPLKYVVVNSVCGWSTRDWNNAGISGTKIQYGRLSFAAKQVQKYLQEMADTGSPVKDNDGSFMTLSEDYPVDYSDYQ